MVSDQRKTPEPGEPWDEKVFKHPLSEGTRREKRNMLACSTVCMLVSILDLHPSGSFLGLNITGIERLGILVPLAAIQLYLGLLFCFSANCDRLMGRVVRSRLRQELHAARLGPIQAMTKAYSHIKHEKVKELKRWRWAIHSRDGMEIWLPWFFWVVALCSCAREACVEWWMR